MTFLDCTSIRAHQKAAGSAPKGGTQAERDTWEALGRSRGGFGSKACAIVDSLGRAVAFVLASGQAHKLPHLIPLIECLPGVPKWVVADRDYTSNAFREHIWTLGGRPAIHRSSGRLPRLDLRQLQPGQATLSTAEGMACHCNTL